MKIFQIVDLIGDLPAQLITPVESSILVRMAIFATYGKNINPGINEIVRQTKFCKRAVLKSISSLVKKNILISDKQRNRGIGETASYEINISLLQEKGVKKQEYYKNLKTNSVKKYPKNKEDRGAPHAPTLGAPHAPTFDENLNTEVHHMHHLGAPHAPTPGAPRAPTPYKHNIKTNINQYIVEPPLDEQQKEIEKKSKKSSKQIHSWTPQVLEVFQHWKDTLNHPASKLDEKRRKSIVKALGWGYSVEDLKKAIEGVKNTPHNMGINDRKKVYDDISLIFRDSRQIERFIRNFDTPEAPINKNGATALKKPFYAKQKECVNMLDEVTEKYFPEFADFLSSKPITQPRQEKLINE